MPYADQNGIPCLIGKLCRIDPEWAATQIESLRANDQLQQEEILKLKELADQEKKHKLHLAMELSNISFVATADEGNHRAIRTIVDDALFEVGLVDKEIG